MSLVRERVPTAPTSSWYHYVREEARFPFYLHHHVEHELIQIRRGQGRRFIGDHVASYAPGDLVLIGSEVPHSFQSDDLPPGRHEALCIQFRTDFMGPELVRTPEFAAVGRMLDDAARGLCFGADTSDQVAAAVGSWAGTDPSSRTVGLLSVLVTMAREHADGRTTTLATTLTPVLRPEQRARIERVCALVAEDFARPWALADVAGEVGMAPASFSRLFSRGFGGTFSAHLTDVRLAAAKQRLRHTDAPIAAIANRCGFANIANFNRRFRAATGTTPSDFRRSTQHDAATTPGDRRSSRSTS